MNKQDIYNALDPSWWIIQGSPWSTNYVSTVIIFDTEAIANCEYTSSAPYQTNGLNAGTGPSTNDLTDFINQLRTEAAQRLFDEHCIAVTGHKDLGYVYGATA